jgi:hypothetical protein
LTLWAVHAISTMSACRINIFSQTATPSTSDTLKISSWPSVPGYILVTIPDIPLIKTYFDGPLEFLVEPGLIDHGLAPDYTFFSDPGGVHSHLMGLLFGVQMNGMVVHLFNALVQNIRIPIVVSVLAAKTKFDSWTQ